MLSHFLLRLSKSPSAIIIGRGFRPHVVPRLCSTAGSVRTARQSTSSSIDCGPQINFLLLCHHRLSCVGPGATNFRQNRSPAAPSGVLAGLYSQTKPYHTDFKATEAANFRRWDTWSSARNLRPKLINQHFNLGYVYRILDALLFNGLLGKGVVLRWVETPVGKTDWLSRTTLISDAKRGPCALVEVMKPLANGPWTLATVQECLEAVLCEMTHVFFLMYHRNCGLSQWSNNRVAIGGQPGHGSSFRKLLRRVEQEANRTLKGFPRSWQLSSPRK